MTDLNNVKEAKGLKFCHLNVRSVLNKIDQFRMHFDESSIDVLSLSETWLSKDICSNILQLSNYQLYRSDRAYTEDQNSLVKKGGGLAIYLRKDMNFTITTKDENNISTPDCELQCIELCSDLQRNILIYNVYRPPSGKIEICIDHITSAMENELGIVNKEVILLGDFNINFQSKGSLETKKLIAWQNKFGLVQHIKGHTRTAKSSRTLIDLIFTNMDHCTDAGIINVHLSDHQPVYVVKKKQRDNRKTTCFRGRTYLGYSKELLSDCLTNKIKKF